MMRVTWRSLQGKVAQRQEFIRRFYGKSRQQQEDELEKLLQYSMNHIDKPHLPGMNVRLTTGKSLALKLPLQNRLRNRQHRYQ